MTATFRLRGIELRYALTLCLAHHGPKTVYELIDALEYHNFAIPGRASKAVSDALRWKVQRGRVRRLRRGLYGPGEMPRATEYDPQTRFGGARASGSCAGTTTTLSGTASA